MSQRLRNLSLYYYTAVCTGLTILLTVTVAKIFTVSHPLRYVFVALLCIGLVPGYLRYRVKVYKKADEGRAVRRYGVLLVLIAVYVALRYLVRNFARHEISGDDYGIAMGFFILGLFVAYYGLSTFHLWKYRHQPQAWTGDTAKR